MEVNKCFELYVEVMKILASEQLQIIDSKELSVAQKAADIYPFNKCMYCIGKLIMGPLAKHKIHAKKVKQYLQRMLRIMRSKKQIHSKINTMHIVLDAARAEKKARTKVIL
jgi:hypothetical protein